MEPNKYQDELKIEEQRILDELIDKMTKVIEDLEFHMQNYVEEAKNADISLNPDLYLSKILMQKGIKDTKANREKMLKARDELYHTRLLVKHTSSEGTRMDELKVGLHSCVHIGDHYVYAWYLPACKPFILDNSISEFDGFVKGKHGEKYQTHYQLLVKNKVDLRFTRVINAMNIYPGVFDLELLDKIKNTGFFHKDFLDMLAEVFNREDYDPESITQIIYDEFLLELLERRSIPEFKNIVFSIQKKQGEIIQKPYNTNIVVQGCAGSGKSMIMLHRLPIILYDSADYLKRNNIFIITPSQMYIQMAENMRHQLEISDINMGTLEQYYNYCIEKYAGHTAEEYGKILYGAKLQPQYEKYVYSSDCISDIQDYLESLCEYNDVSLSKALNTFSIIGKDESSVIGYAQRIQKKLSTVQQILSANNNSMKAYYKGIWDVLNALKTVSSNLKNYKQTVINNIEKSITKEEDDILTAQKELENKEVGKNDVAIRNRHNTIDAARKSIIRYKDEIKKIEGNDEPYNELLRVNKEIEGVINSFSYLKSAYSDNTVKGIYGAINQIGQLIGDVYKLSWELSKVDNRYGLNINQTGIRMDKTQDHTRILQNINAQLLDFEYYYNIRKLEEELTNINTNAVKNTYAHIMNKLGVEPNDKGKIKGLTCSPYLYLQIMFQYQGAPNAVKESLLSIDEAQGIAPEEMRLLKKINDNNAVFNVFGDIYQHVEGTKGINSWNEYDGIFDYEYHEMQENYRNASQITEYCTKTFGIDMIAINTPGKGVKEIASEEEFSKEITKLLTDSHRDGLAAVLVSNDSEADYLLEKFSKYEEKFHDMTKDTSLHHTRWNIMKISDAKGLEFTSVIALSGRMTKNERYIAYTRALDELYVYSLPLNITNFAKKEKATKEQKIKKSENDADTANINASNKKTDKKPTHAAVDRKKEHNNSEVRTFFQEHGMNVIDKRDVGGRLWVVGDKSDIRSTVNAAIAEFNISGKYMSGKEINNKNGWATKTDK